MAYQILVVDDEPEIADLIELYLKNEGFTVHTCYSAAAALACIETERLDLALLDVMLPDTDGFAICRKIRETHTYPVIMLTARDQEIDKILKAQLRRSTQYNRTEGEPEERVIAFSGLVLNQDTHECSLDEKPLSLTPTEFSILWFLCANRGRVISSEELFHEVWGEKYFTGSNNTVMVHIRHLREKMHDPAEHPKYIKTVWGVGYKIEK